MANYRRQGSHLAQFMREQLNVAPSEPEEDFSNIDNLDLFANTQFFDFDTQTPTDFKPAADSPPSSKPDPTSATSTIPGEFGSMDFNMSNGRSFELSTYVWCLLLRSLGCYSAFTGPLCLSPSAQSVQAEVLHGLWPSPTLRVIMVVDARSLFERGKSTPAWRGWILGRGW